MPVRKTVQKTAASPGTCDVRTGQYSLDGVGAPYRPVQPLVARPAAMTTSKRMHTSSTRDLKYFFDIAQSLYRNAGSRESSTADPMRDNPPSDGSIDNTSVDPSAVLVMWLFRRTLTEVLPVAERFHLGPADRQPLYSLTSQPSIRSAREFNELVIKRRDPIIGAWHSVCISDIEPCLDLTKTGSWRVSTLVMDSVPVWKKVVSGQVIKEEVHLVQGNKLRLTWGDRAALGPLGDAYGLWWEGGVDSGMAEAFYIVERWGGFDSAAQGMIEAKAAVKRPDGQYGDPRHSKETYAIIYFHMDGRTPPQFVCTSSRAQVRLDILVSGLMTVMVIETRKTAMEKEGTSDMESPPPYSNS